MNLNPLDKEKAAPETSNREEQEETNFGFTKVSNSAKRHLVDEVFSNVAENYDLMNDLLSFGMHRLWKDKFCNKIENLNSNIIDMAGGTGDISLRLFNKASRQEKLANITVCDINYDMLKICQTKAIDQNIISGLNIVTCDAEKLPFADNSFDYYTIAFGIRNTISLENALSEAYRVLKPTGKFLCLEFSKIQGEFAKNLYDAYSFKLIPQIGKYVAKNESAYAYLAESINLFPSQEEFRQKIIKAGFDQVSYENLTFGVAAIHWGYKI